MTAAYANNLTTSFCSNLSFKFPVLKLLSLQQNAFFLEVVHNTGTEISTMLTRFYFESFNDVSRVHDFPNLRRVFIEGA